MTNQTSVNEILLKYSEHPSIIAIKNNYMQYQFSFNFVSTTVVLKHINELNTKSTIYQQKYLRLLKTLGYYL